VSLATAATLTAGPAWVEGGDGDEDAGSLPNNAQATVGEGPLLMIFGSLDGVAGAAGEPDLHDMYFIFIDDPVNFRATTVARAATTSSGWACSATTTPAATRAATVAAPPGRAPGRAV
jgi:hypothetical protein